jgi:pimeloyl-ACP methyl ester carboxylesterase
MDPLGSKTNLAHYVAWSRGKGPLVVLLHGWPVCSHHWRHLAGSLESSGFRALAIDLKGLGESTSGNGAFEKAEIAQELLRLIPENKFSLVGHDWGGSIAIAMAALQRDRVCCLIIEEEMPPGIGVALRGEGSLRYPTWHGDFHRVPGLAESLIRGREDRYIGFFLDLRADPSSLAPEDREHFLRHYRSEATTSSMLAYYRSREADAKFFSALEQAKLALPVLAVGGKFAMGSSVAHSARKIAMQVSEQVFQHSAHYPAEEEPREFNRRVESFLESSPASR